MLAKITRCFLLVALVVAVVPRAVMAQTETLAELYKKALKEDGVLNCYCSLAQINAEKIFPVFEKRFPGIKINHVDATSDKLAARAITEARGGKTFADVVEFGLQDINKIHEQGLILEKVPPEGAAYPANLKGSYWVANNLIFFVGAWNTEKVKKHEEPKSLDDSVIQDGKDGSLPSRGTTNRWSASCTNTRAWTKPGGSYQDRGKQR